MTRPVVGMLHELGEAGPVVVGRQVAVDQLLKAFARFGEGFDYRLYGPSRQRGEIERRLSAGPTGRFAVRDRLELAGPAPPGVAAWHEPQLEMHLPFAIRERLGGAYPVTVLHHTLSYQRLLHESFLRLLLADTRPFDAVVCTSAAAREAVRRIVEDVTVAFNERHGTALAFGGRYELIPLATDTERFRPRPRAEARRRFDLPDDAFVLLWVGRMSLVDKADLLPLIDAFELLVRDNPARRPMLVCAGTQRAGERFGDVLAAYAARPALDGRVRVMTDDAGYGGDLPELYAAADVFVSPVDNLQESFGITPIEAMACGIPQVVSDWNGYRDTVVHEDTGFLVPTLWARCDDELVATAGLGDDAHDHLMTAQSVAVDMRAFRAAVQRLLDEPALAARMGEASRARAEARFGWRPVVAAHERLWEELSAEAAAAGPAAAGARPDYGVLRFGRIFEGYPSRMLGDDAALRLTDRGRSLLGGQASLPMHYNRDFQYLDVALIQRAMAGLARFDGASEPLTLGRIVSVLTRGDAHPAGAARVTRHVMWLLKYGYVEVAP